MALPSPKTSKEYPIYIAAYILVFFLISFLFSSLSILNRISKDGLYVEYYPCLIEGTDDWGRPTCELIGKTPNNLIPVGNWLKNQAETDLIFVVIIGLPLGLYSWYSFINKGRNNENEYEY
jgi:hypothetical protein